jgi:hypothetical protein
LRSDHEKIHGDSLFRVFSSPHNPSPVRSLCMRTRFTFDSRRYQSHSVTFSHIQRVSQLHTSWRTMTLLIGRDLDKSNMLESLSIIYAINRSNVLQFTDRGIDKSNVLKSLSIVYAIYRSNALQFIGRVSTRATCSSRYLSFT